MELDGTDHGKYVWGVAKRSSNRGLGVIPWLGDFEHLHDKWLDGWWSDPFFMVGCWLKSTFQRLVSPKQYQTPHLGMEYNPYYCFRKEMEWVISAHIYLYNIDTVSSLLSQFLGINLTNHAKWIPMECHLGDRKPVHTSLRVTPCGFQALLWYKINNHERWGQAFMLGRHTLIMTIREKVGNLEPASVKPETAWHCWRSFIYSILTAHIWALVASFNHCWKSIS